MPIPHSLSTGVVSGLQVATKRYLGWSHESGTAHLIFKGYVKELELNVKTDGFSFTSLNIWVK